jgi:Delta14-sterol reductase
LSDFWYGTSLNPRILGIDCKTFAYRPGMLTVLLINLSVAVKQYQLYGTITLSMFLYQVFMGWYVIDYFIFEQYILSIYDIVEERFGFMLIVR